MIRETQSHRLIERAFSKELSAADSRALHAHLKGCEACRARYDRSTQAERFLAGRVGAPSERELERILGAVEATLEAEQPRARFAWFPRLVPALGAFGAAALALAVFSLRPAPEHELRARGGPTAAPQGALRAFCLAEGGAVELGARGTACSRESQLKLSLGNPGSHRFAFVVGVQGDGHALWYAPRPPSTESAPAPAKAEGEVPFGPTMRLGVNHEAGPLRIYALFSDEPLAMAEVEAAIGAAKADGVGAATLPITRAGVVQQSLLVEVTP